MLFGGAMFGPQTTALKTQLGPLLNGIVVSENWVPAPTMQFPGVIEFLRHYQAKAASEGVDPLAYFLPPWAYARMQMIAQAIEGTQSIDDGKLADYFGSHRFKTIIGDFSFGKEGEWAAARVAWTQFQNIKGHDLEQFKDPSTEVVLLPAGTEVGDNDLVIPRRPGSSRGHCFASSQPGGG